MIAHTIPSKLFQEDVQDARRADRICCPMYGLRFHVLQTPEPTLQQPTRMLDVHSGAGEGLVVPLLAASSVIWLSLFLNEVISHFSS